MTLVQKEPKNIYISKEEVVSDMQGPCESGYHVPLKSEWGGVVNAGVSLGAWTTSSGKTNFCTYMKIPMAGLRDTSSSTSSQGSQGIYWACDFEGAPFAYNLYIMSGGSVYVDSAAEILGGSIRPFKDTPVTPDSSWTTIYQGTGTAGIYYKSDLGLISISSNGTTRYTIADKNLGATTVYTYGNTLSEANCGKYYQRGNNYGFAWTGSVTTSSTKVDASNYGPGNYYESSTFITGSSAPYNWDSSNNDNLRGGVTQGSGTVTVTTDVKAVFIGNTQVRPGPLTTPGVYWNEQLGLISLSSDGENWVTIADKNLGATTVYNDGDALSESNCGNYFQWGNNYAFPFTGSVSTATGKVNVQGYGPNNYYSSSLFYINSDGSWTTTNNTDLWGDSTDTSVARRGPCDIGYHIWTKAEYENILSILQSLGILPSGNGSRIKQYLKMPYSGRRNYNNGNTNYQGSYGLYWTSSTTGNYSYELSFYQGYWVTPSGDYREGGQPIRPIKNEPVAPYNTWTVLFEKTALKFTANTANSTVKLQKNGSPTSVILETSTDGKNWSKYTIGTVITLSNIGDAVYFRNTSETDTGFSTSNSDYYKFVMSGSIAASGDITSLLNKNWTTTLSNYCFSRLFMDCTSLTTPPSLLPTTLTNYCYYYMFFGCTGLTVAPDLPATTLGQYCYQYMFRGCTSLTEAPDLSSATTLANYCCTGMFYNCTNLESLPRLTATTLPSNCYNTMFYGCSKIKMNTVKTGIYQQQYRIPRSGTGSTGSNSLYNMFTSTGGAFSGTPQVNVTYYMSNTVV